ncbi:MAG: YjzD family protein [Bacillaceae bacterium]
MRYVLALVWSLLLINMSYYILGAMSGVAYDFQTASILGLAVGVLVIILANCISDEGFESPSH